MRAQCTVPECNKRVQGHGWCAMHYRRWRVHGDLSVVRNRWEGHKSVGYKNTLGYLVVTVDGHQAYEHVVVAERALGKPLPPKSEVHHVDENKSNNVGANLVVCPNRAYHLLLHRRQRAQDACGNANWRKCSVCKQHDDPANLYVKGKNSWHRHCMNEKLKRKRHAP